MLLYERLKPGRNWPRVRGWWLRAVFLNAVQVIAVMMGGVLWNRWMSQHQLWSIKPLGTAAGAVIGYVTITFVYYWWHRWRHDFDVLWRWFHQVHHSAQRIEVLTSFYKHPLEIFLNTILSSLILYVCLGLTTVAASSAVLLTGLGELFYHWNVSTPFWLGYFF